jgi:hypothetical protein
VTSVIGCLVSLAAAGGASAAMGSFGKALSGALLAAIQPKRCVPARRLPRLRTEKSGYALRSLK